jgi:hypothetical protein
MAEIVPVDPKGPQLTVEVRCGHAQAGAYVLKLWDANEVVQREEGTFFDPTDDTYKLTGTAAKQVGRLLQCTAELEIIPPIKQFALLMTVWQGSKRVGPVLTASGETDEPQVTRSLFARFTAEGP